MVKDLTDGVQGQHASSLGGLIAREIANQFNIPAYIVDPVVVDELSPEARISGIPEIERRAIWHPLNQKAVVRKAAAEIGKECTKAIYRRHLGGGISVAAHLRGQAVDVNNALHGDGPFSPEAGGVPVGTGGTLLQRQQCSKQEIQKKLVGQGGWWLIPAPMTAAPFSPH